MSVKQRIKQLEKTSGAGRRIRYVCFSNPGDTEYTAKPAIEGTGEAYTFATVEAMTAYFDECPHFELLHVIIEYASEAEGID